MIDKDDPLFEILKTPIGQKVFSELEDIIPFKRIRAPQHLLDKYNREFVREEGYKITEFAITVDKDCEITDELVWEAMTMKPKITKTYSSPPFTGKKKTVI